MKNKLRNMIDSIITGDHRTASKCFNEYTTAKSSTIISEMRAEVDEFGDLSPSEEYEAARAAASVASAKFDQVKKSYRERIIGDAEFLAARREYMKAQEVFDAAFDAEQARGDSYREGG